MEFKTCWVVASGKRGLSSLPSGGPVWNHGSWCLTNYWNRQHSFGPAYQFPSSRMAFETVRARWLLWYSPAFVAGCCSWTPLSLQRYLSDQMALVQSSDCCWYGFGGSSHPGSRASVFVQAYCCFSMNSWCYWKMAHFRGHIWNCFVEALSHKETWTSLKTTWSPQTLKKYLAECHEAYFGSWDRRPTCHSRLRSPQN